MDEGRIRRVLALVVAVLVLALFGVFAVRAYGDSNQPIPSEMFPLATLAAGYLFGFGVIRKQ